MKWITREKPKIDRIACPWLIRRFIDPEAVFIYAPFDAVLLQAEQLSAIPFDIPGVAFTHYNDKCTFDYFVEKYRITDPAIHTLAAIVRGADTDRHDIAKQSSGLWAISAGLAYNCKDDHALLEQGMVLYDALYSWARFLQGEKHTQQPVDSLFLEVFNQFIKQKKGKKKPGWVQEIRHMIQDQIDSSISLKELSKGLDINPSYLSREFSKCIDPLIFGQNRFKI